MTVGIANKAIWYDKPVIFDGREYQITGIVKRKHPRQHAFLYQAELKDKVANSSLVYADLDRVKLKGDDEA